MYQVNDIIENKMMSTTTQSLYAKWRVLEKDYKFEKDKLIKAIAANGPYYILCAAEYKDTKCVATNIAVAAFTDEGRALSFGAAFRDLTEKKHGTSMRVWIHQRPTMSSCDEVITDVNPFSVEATCTIYEQAIKYSQHAEAGERKIDVFYISD